MSPKSCRWFTLAVLLASSACVAAPPESNALIVCGERVPIDAPVVLWTDPGGYDAYSQAATLADQDADLNHLPGRRPTYAGDEGSPVIPLLSDDVAALREVVDLFVIHYDVCGTSRRCFDVLNRRGLSVHFLLDVDGTIYQTMDLRDTGWHATRANYRSVGVEIANMGGRAPEKLAALEPFYGTDTAGAFLRLPPERGDGGVRTAGFFSRPPRPARPEAVQGIVQGKAQVMYDFTPEQYDSLVQLAAALCRTFPRIRPDAPRDAEGNVSMVELSDEEFAAFGGLIGHHHVDDRKVDPGPAFQWDAFIERVRRELARP